MIRPTQGLSSARPAPIDPALKKAAEGFEAMFLRQLLSEMRQGQLAEDVLGSSASDSYRDMADRQMADTLSKSGALGIAQMVEAQFRKSGGGA